MPTKINTATKQLALQKLRDGLSPKEVSELTGVSTRTVERWRGKVGEKSAMLGRTAATSRPTQVPTPDATQSDEEKTTLDFQESPDPVEKKGVVDTALSSLKGMLGIADKKDGKTSQPVFSAKLDSRRQQFVESASPTLSLAFMALAAWMWGRIGPEYSVLAPDDTAAQKIVEPLLRVYARHASFMTDINPDVADVGASMFALVGYAHVSLQLYQKIKADQQEEEEYGPNTETNPVRRRYRTSPEPEDGVGDQSRGYAGVQWGNGRNDSVPSNNGRHTESVAGTTLTDKESYQRAALSRLTQLDFEHRARRSLQS